MEYGVGHFSDLAVSLIVHPARSGVCRHQGMPRKSPCFRKPWSARHVCLYLMAFCLGFVVWVLVCCYSLGCCCQTSPPPMAASSQSAQSWLQSWDPRGEMLLPIPMVSGLKPCTCGDVKAQTLSREHHCTRDQPKGDLSFIGFFSYVFRLFYCLMVTPGCLRCGCQTLNFCCGTLSPAAGRSVQLSPSPCPELCAGATSGTAICPQGEKRGAVPMGLVRALCSSQSTEGKEEEPSPGSRSSGLGGDAVLELFKIKEQGEGFAQNKIHKAKYVTR